MFYIFYKIKYNNKNKMKGIFKKKKKLFQLCGQFYMRHNRVVGSLVCDRRGGRWHCVTAGAIDVGRHDRRRRRRKWECGPRARQPDGYLVCAIFQVVHKRAWACLSAFCWIRTGESLSLLYPLYVASTFFFYYTYYSATTHPQTTRDQCMIWICLCVIHWRTRNANARQPFSILCFSLFRARVLCEYECAGAYILQNSTVIGTCLCVKGKTYETGARACVAGRDEIMIGMLFCFSYFFFFF